jgi:hypothetical protein
MATNTSNRTLVNGNIQDVPGAKVNILEGQSIGHSKQKSVYVLVYVFYSERLPR